MKKNVTKLLFITFLLAEMTAHGQVRVPVTNNDLRINLQKIISDFPRQFSTLKGDTLVDNPQTIEFASLLDFKSARENLITQYKSTRPIYSWQATLLFTEEFEEAESKYKWLYNQLRVMTINLDGGYSYSLDGKYGGADESRKFSSSVFKLTPNVTGMPKLKIEASLQFQFPEWKVLLLVYEKEREDGDRGDLYEEGE